MILPASSEIVCPLLPASSVAVQDRGAREGLMRHHVSCLGPMFAPSLLVASRKSASGS